MRVIDIHTHGIGGLDTANSAPLQILRIAETQAAHGISDIVLSVYPGPVEAMRWHMMIVHKAMERQRLEPSPGAARILGIHLEGPFINPARAGALNAAAFLPPTIENAMRIIEGFEQAIRIITVAPELEDACALIDRLTSLGIIVSMGHSDATYAEAEAGYQAGAKGVTHIFNAMRPVHHREPGLAGFGLHNPDLYVEVIADSHHLDEATLDLIFKVKGPDKIIIVSDSVKETKRSLQGASCPQGPVTDNTGRLLGGSATVIEASQKLIQRGYSEQLIHRCISENPANYLTARR